jgi:hypothetical protein
VGLLAWVFYKLRTQIQFVLGLPDTALKEAEKAATKLVNALKDKICGLIKIC